MGKNIDIIAIGASTGGAEALSKVLRKLPKDMPGMVIVQHMPAGFTKMHADTLNKMCKIEVREARNGESVQRGVALIAPGNKQMRIWKDDKGYYVTCREEEKVGGHIPSVDVLFKSVAKVVGDKAIGVILTGMGKDGAEGLLEMRKAGAYTIGQNEESSVVYGMPKVAYDIGAVKIQIDIKDISNLILKEINKKDITE